VNSTLSIKDRLNIVPTILAGFLSGLGSLITIYITYSYVLKKQRQAGIMAASLAG
jgi:hypothetical protein